jgi:hypothetical protein
MVGLQDTGSVTWTASAGDSFDRLDHRAGRNSATRALARRSISAKRYVNRFTQAWQKRFTTLKQTKKSQNRIDADSELNHVTESSLHVTRFASA